MSAMWNERLRCVTQSTVLMYDSTLFVSIIFEMLIIVITTDGGSRNRR